ncbi:hypothetical protein PPSIR1_02481 [Plesiocystis pacifica SIR-1]|uniref:Lipoprotein n=1 Tax=Plesiocystis pacifica SIR-1 TaxID=391625 RepID=A6G460_9BACT|nr:hypothetical protein [Plesiocystis pacifica]EDM79383.1 hypothetical protein PPSIR1_02481 [Plesiocystis pacifica SIR-1]
MTRLRSLRASAWPLGVTALAASWLLSGGCVGAEEAAEVEARVGLLCPEVEAPGFGVDITPENWPMASMELAPCGQVILERATLEGEPAGIELVRLDGSREELGDIEALRFSPHGDRARWLDGFGRFVLRELEGEGRSRVYEDSVSQSGWVGTRAGGSLSRPWVCVARNEGDFIEVFDFDEVVSFEVGSCDAGGEVRSSTVVPRMLTRDRDGNLVRLDADSGESTVLVPGSEIPEDANIWMDPLGTVASFMAPAEPGGSITRRRVYDGGGQLVAEYPLPASVLAVGVGERRIAIVVTESQAVAFVEVEGELRVYPIHTGESLGISTSRTAEGGTVVLAFTDGTIVAMPDADPERLEVIGEHIGPPTDLLVSPEGEWVAWKNTGGCLAPPDCSNRKVFVERWSVGGGRAPTLVTAAGNPEAIVIRSLFDDGALLLRGALVAEDGSLGETFEQILSAGGEVVEAFPADFGTVGNLRGFWGRSADGRLLVRTQATPSTLDLSLLGSDGSLERIGDAQELWSAAVDGGGQRAISVSEGEARWGQLPVSVD